MIVWNFFISFLLFQLYNYQKLPQCEWKKPFLMTDYSCADFNEICLKKDNKQCQTLLEACDQCPPSNFTMKMLQMVDRNVKEQINYTKTFLENKILELKNDLLKNNSKDQSAMSVVNIENKWNSATKMIILLLAINIFILIILIVLLILVVKFRFLRNLRNYQNIENHEFQNVLLNEIGTTNNIDVVVDISNFQFQINGVEKLFELQIHKEDNGVKIKKQVCAKWISAKENDYKRMKLKYNRTTLDDNDYLLKQIGSNNDVINCDIDDAINVNNLIILQLQANIAIPEFIQISKDQTILNMEKIITKVSNCHDITIFKDSKKLPTSLLIDKCNFKDYDWIKVIMTESKNITINSIFELGDPVKIECSNIEQVSSVKSKVSEKLETEEIVLFSNNKLLDKDSYLFEIGNDQDSQISYCHLMNSDLLKLTSGNIENGDSCQIFEAREKWTNKQVILKRYDLTTVQDIKENAAFLNELITFLVTKSHSRFISLTGVFKDKEFLYIAMKKMTGGSLKQLLQKYQENNVNITEQIIASWSKQILEGLQYLHKNNIIHRNIKPSNILLDENNNIKLSSFGVSKYLQGYDPSYLVQGFIQSKVGTYRYMAPEVCNSDAYGVQADVWSFGATLVEIVTGKPPYNGESETTALMQIANNGKIEYDLPSGCSLELKRFIESCLITNPKERATIDQLLGDSFLNN